jgi:virulence-associated protein VagC
MTTTEIFHTGDGQVVRLPQGFEFTTREVAIRRDGDAVILEPIKGESWPTGFFEKIRVDDPAFERPRQTP